jgi:hypothetical protein
MEIDRVAAWLERPDLLGIFLVGLAIFVIGRIPVVGLIVYPFYLFYVFVHELSHGFAAILTGRPFDRFYVRRDLTGEAIARTRTGPSLTFTSAGFVGAALFGAALVFLAEGTFPARVTLFGVGLAFVLLCVWYVRNLFGLMMGLLLGALLMYAGTRLSDAASQVVLWLLAITIFVETFATLLGVGHIGGDPSDAESAAKMTGLPRRLVQLIWAGLAALFLLYALNIGYGVPLPWEGP